MADLNQRILAYLQTIRVTQIAAQPAQALDTTSIWALDIPTTRNLDTTPTDLNTTYNEIR